jgi:hypothetical protein
MEKLNEIDVENWLKLRDLYKIDWPRYISSYNLIDLLFQFKSRDNSLDFIKIYCCDENWNQHGTYFASVSFYFRFNSKILINFPLKFSPYNFCDSLDGTGTHLKQLMELIDWREQKMVRAWRDSLVPIVLEFGKKLQLNISCEPAFEYYLPSEKIVVLELNVPEGLKLKSLTKSNAQEVDENWAKRSQGTVKYQEILIEMNPSVGLFKKSGELLGWCLM